jgi:gamma-glutamylcyclotransferase (GGCT)/AIG2-like uncharacterized protein YtfP
MKVTQPNMTASVFVYGSLLFDEVVERLTGKLFRAEEASLADHARYAVKEEGRVAKGPAIICEPGKVVQGRLLRDIDSDTLRILDRFECGDPDHSRYERVSVSVTLQSGEVVPAETYRAATELRPFLCGDWSEKDFKAGHLEFYLNEWIPLLRQEWGMS